MFFFIHSTGNCIHIYKPAWSVKYMGDNST